MSWHWDDLTIGSDGAPIVTSDPTNLASHVFDAEATQHVFYRAGEGTVHFDPRFGRWVRRSQHRDRRRSGRRPGT